MRSNEIRRCNIWFVFTNTYTTSPIREVNIAPVCTVSYLQINFILEKNEMDMQKIVWFDWIFRFFSAILLFCYKIEALSIFTTIEFSFFFSRWKSIGISIFYLLFATNAHTHTLMLKWWKLYNLSFTINHLKMNEQTNRREKILNSSYLVPLLECITYIE